jgi:hypothetical protein
VISLQGETKAYQGIMCAIVPVLIPLLLFYFSIKENGVYVESV